MNIGSKIRELRKTKKMTLEDLSKESGVAVATLSRIETGRMTGTLDSHMNIARAFNISLPQLYADIGLETTDTELVEKDTRGDVFIHSDKSAYEILTSKVLDKKMMPTLIKIEPTGTTNPEQTPSGTEKFIYVLEGNLEINIADKKYTLHEADSLYFQGSATHYCKNLGDSTVKIICVISPPAL
ncbi:helix-turn-helix domain-containing protein [Candidatus Omnitrophota bacterium]